jgi:arginase family enzyme
MSGSVVWPVDASQVLRFAGAATFAWLPRIYEVLRADVAVVEVPFDSGVSYRPCARFGPALDRVRKRLGAAPNLRVHGLAVRDLPHAPGTGTPKRAADDARTAHDAARPADLDVISADIVEVAPDYNEAELTSMAASHVAFELLSVMSCRPRSLHVR